MGGFWILLIIFVILYILAVDCARSTEGFPACFGFVLLLSVLPLGFLGYVLLAIHFLSGGSGSAGLDQAVSPFILIYPIFYSGILLTGLRRKSPVLIQYASIPAIMIIPLIAVFSYNKTTAQAMMCLLIFYAPLWISAALAKENGEQNKETDTISK